MEKQSLGVNPWTHIWTKPRDTIAKIVQFNPKHRFLFLSFLYGLPLLLHFAQNLSLGENFSTIGIVIAAVVLATFVGMLALSIASGLLLWTGKWIGGQGEYYPIRAAVSWANVPNILFIIVWGILIYFFGDQVFLESFGDGDFRGWQTQVVTVAFLAQAVLSVWSFIILVKGLGEVQGFSAWKGVLNVLIPFFMIGAVIWVISWIIWMAVAMSGA